MTVVAPKLVVPPPVVVVLRSTALPLTTNAPAAFRVLLPASVRTAVMPPTSLRLMPVPTAVTVPPKLLVAVLSVMLCPVAVRPLLPVTSNVPL